MKYLRFILLVTVFYSVTSANGQSDRLDSLNEVANTAVDQKTIIETTIEIGLHYRMLAVDTAVIIFNNAIDMAIKANERELAAKAIMELAGYYAYAAENIEKSVTTAQQARDVIAYQGDTAQLYLNYAGRAELFAGMLATDRGQYTEAQGHFLNAQDYFEQLDEKRFSLFAYNQLIVLYNMQDMLSEAEQLLDKAILLCQDNNWMREEVLFLCNRASVQYNQGTYLESITSLKQARQTIFDELDTTDHYTLGSVYEIIGDNYSQLGNYDSSFFYHKKSLYHREQLNIPSGMINTYSTLSRDCSKLGKLDEAKKYCTKMQGILDVNDENKLMQVMAYQAWIAYYKASNQYQFAIETMDTLMVLKESMINEENIRTQTEQKKDFEFEKERLTNAQEISSKDETIVEEKALSDNLKISLVIMGILLILLGWLFYTNLKQRKLVSDINKQLNASVNEKETLLKEIHHRVKNNLQLVSSLLGLQSQSIQDEAALDAFEEGQNRVQAIALIHQKLYQNDIASEIDFEDYLHGLANHFKDLNDSNKAVDIEIECKDIKLDIDTAIPLGLIINELFTNAYKHAFANTNTPKISVSIKNEGNGDYAMEMTDNGIGLPVDFDWSKPKTLGLRLIRNLVRQLIGNINYRNQEQLSVFSIQFKSQIGRNLLE